MYLVKKCDNYHGYGRRTWRTIFANEDRAGAIAVFKGELRAVLEADPRLTRADIENRLPNWYLDNTSYGNYFHNRRVEMGHGGTGFAIYKSTAKEYDLPTERPTRTEALDKILGC